MRYDAQQDAVKRTTLRNRPQIIGYLLQKRRPRILPSARHFKGSRLRSADTCGRH